MNVREWLEMAEARLLARDIPSAKLEAQVLAAHVLLVERSWLYAHPTEPFPELAGESLLQRRESHEPLAYIVGRREFYGRRFEVRPGVLIPRQDTETLIDVALTLPARRVLDIGTGSGCIAITLKLERPDWHVTALDTSPVALQVARQNGESLGAEIDWIESDLFEAVSDERYDLIVTNPPYIGVSEELMPEVSEHEPHLALFAGQSGLDFYERLSSEAGVHLEPGGALATEVGYRQAADVRSLFEGRGWRTVLTQKGLDGTERVIVFARQ